MAMINWRRVTKQAPCIVCQKGDWCRVFDSGTVHCMRVPSDTPCKSGGWLHRQAKFVPFTPRLRTRTPTIDSEAMWRRWLAATSQGQLQGLGEALGVKLGALRMLGAVWASGHDAWAWPMYDGSGKMVGLRLRNDAGKKWAVLGSRQGLFVPRLAPSSITAVICEGPTDTAAMLSIGCYAIGRPSCQGCMDELRQTLNRLGLWKVIIIADNDEPKHKPDGTTWYPGQEGALKLQDHLKMPSVLVTPPVKDAREWVKQGCTTEVLTAVSKQKVWRYV